jgi:hypothetical protein
MFDHSESNPHGDLKFKDNVPYMKLKPGDILTGEERLA